MERLTKKRTTCRGVTLTELLISSILVGIVMIGALSSDYVIRSWQRRIEQRALVQMSLATTMEQILRHGRLTNGSNVARIDGSGIALPNFMAANWGTGVVYEYSSNILCFFEDLDITSNNLTDESYHCYTAMQIAGAISFKYSLKESRYTFNGVTVSNTETTLMSIFTPHNPDDATNAPFFNVNLNADNKIESIDLFLTTRFDVNSDEHSLNNPNYSLETSFSMPSLSQ